jgi:amidohydrolase
MPLAINRGRRPFFALAVSLLFAVTPLFAAISQIAKIDRLATEIENQVIAWRRDVHEHPELSNREFRTARLVADHLRTLGMEVHTGIAVTGVTGVLRGGRDGPVVALRADMDALPVTEQTGLPFASTATDEFHGDEVGVMHACGHDAHVGIMMGVAQILAAMRDELPGTVKFIFQPAEEGAYPARTWGAKMMVEEGVLKDPRPDAIFGLHVWAASPAGSIGFRAGPTMASADYLRITVKGRQTHAAAPWMGVDPIVVASQIVLALQTIPSRQINVLEAPSIVSIGTIKGGQRNNIIPDSVEMTGTIRAFDPVIREKLHEKVRRTAVRIAESAGAEADVTIGIGYPTTVNDPALTKLMAPTLRRVAGPGQYYSNPLVTGAEDFSYYQEVIPGLYFFLGITTDDEHLKSAAFNHSPLFTIDESALLVGVRALSHLAIDFLQANSP